MSGFGLLTAINVDDIPKVLMRCVVGWRGGVYREYPLTWQMAADEVERFAGELAAKIALSKQEEPKPKRQRVVMEEARGPRMRRRKRTPRRVRVIY